MKASINNTPKLLKITGITALYGILILGVFTLIKSCPGVETKVAIADSLKVDKLKTDSLKKAPKTAAAPISVNDNITNFSSMLAGFIPDNMRDKLEDNSSWIDIQGAMHEEWERVVTDKVLPIQEWTDESPLAKLDSGILFYPFAGADFLYSNCFFPRSNRIVMVGLEPIGSISEKMEFNDKFYNYMKCIKSSLYTSNLSGYFMTIKMGTELKQSDLNGVLPLILFYARRQAFLISSINYVSIDENGKQIPSTYEDTSGVVIKLTDKDRKTLKTIEYYRTDLSDGEFKPGSRYHTYFSSFQNKNVFLKAASYLLHRDSFSNIRNVILENTQILLQDDSGMPYRYIATNDWNLELYGKYTRPIGLFSERVQSDLREAFQQRGGKELPFRIGYNISHNEPHLILAQRKK
jgi:hypothetical protein